MTVVQLDELVRNLLHLFDFEKKKLGISMYGLHCLFYVNTNKIQWLALVKLLRLRLVNNILQVLISK